MSKRDRALVREIGLSVAQVAAALGRSRQAVNRGMAQTKDYLGSADLVTMLGHWRAENAELYRLAKQKIRELYPELAKFIASEGVPEALPFSPVPGRYWLLTGDYSAFRTNLARCAEQFDGLCEQKESKMTVLVHERDVAAARRLEGKFGRRIEVKVAPMDLRLMPSVLLRVEQDGQTDLFGAADAGFIALSRQEATRLRLALQDTLLDRDKT